MSRPALRIGVVGLGTIAQFYLRALDRVAEVELLAVCDTKDDRLAPFRERVAAYRDLDAMLANDLDAIVLCVPNDVHEEVARAVLRAGKHVCVEKPLALDRAAGERMLALADSRSLVLFTAFHRRYNRHIVELARALEGRTVRRAAARYLESIEEHVGVDPWYLDPARCGGGCIADNGPNAFDTLRHLFGDLSVVACEAYAGRFPSERQSTVRLETKAGMPVEVELDWSYPDGEAKDVTVWLDDGTTLRADMLRGFEAFKSSLDHEYEAIVRDFARAVRTFDPRAKRVAVDPGLRAIELVEDAYRAAGLFPRDFAAAPEKRVVRGRLAKILTHRREDRGMRLIEEASRCVRTGELHELVTTDQAALGAGDRVDRTGFVGFVEIDAAGVIERGDRVEVGGRPIGTVIGFDGCHFPNHYNIVIQSPELLTGASLRASVEYPVRFLPSSSG